MIVREIQRPPRATAVVGPSGDQFVDNIRQLAIQLLVQAVRDVKGRQPQLKDSALRWLNSAEGRDLALALGLRWAASGKEITVDALTPQRRNTYFRGGD